MNNRRWMALVAVLAVVGGIEIYVWTATKQTEPGPTTFNPLEYFPHLKRGEVVPAFDGEDPEGRTKRVDYSESQKTLLFVMSATCGTCRENLPRWNRILGELPSDVRAFGLLVGSGESYSYQAEQNLLESAQIRFPILRFHDEEDVERYKLTKVPQTILIGPKGRVEACFMGELSGDTLDELRMQLGLHREERP